MSVHVTFSNYNMQLHEMDLNHQVIIKTGKLTIFIGVLQIESSENARLLFTCPFIIKVDFNVFKDILIANVLWSRKV